MSKGMDCGTSQLIYEAWKATPKPLIYQTADAKGNRIDKEVDFADPKEHRDYHAEASGFCNLCGKPFHGGIPVKKLLGISYMDWPIHKAPDQAYICESCAFCLGMNPVGRVALFRYPLVAEKILHLCNRAQLRDWLLSPPDPPFVMILPTSQKKHLFAKARISYSRETFWCNLEEITVPVTSTFKWLIESIEMLRGLGINKSQIDSGTISAQYFKTWGVGSAEWALQLIEQIKADPAYSLALEVAQKMTEEDAICCRDSRLTTK